MTSGPTATATSPKNARRRSARAALAALASLAVAAVTGVSTSAAAAFDLAALTAMLGRVGAGEATFVEKRRVELLDRTLESSGRLSFKAPDTFVRETLKPRHEKLAVAGNVVTMSLGERSRSMSLDASPEAAVIVEAIRGTLTGNRESLEKLFDARVSGSAERWTLELVPRDLRLRGQVASVRIGGREQVAREVEILLADGDRSVMTIEPTASSPARSTR